MTFDNLDIVQFINDVNKGSFFDLKVGTIDKINFQEALADFDEDYSRYYNEKVDLNKIKYYRGLLATFFYRISRHAYLNGKEPLALELSTLSAYVTGIELFYSAEIGSGLRINHGVGTVVGARSKVGRQVLLHQNVTLGEKNGRPTIGDYVVIYPGAVVVGPITVGNGSIIGANTFLDKSIPVKSVFK